MKKTVDEIFAGEYTRPRTVSIYMNAYSVLCGILNVQSWNSLQSHLLKRIQLK